MWVFILKINMFIYGKCPKTLKVADKMAYTNSADPDETAPTVCHSTKKQMHKM